MNTGKKKGLKTYIVRATALILVICMFLTEVPLTAVYAADKEDESIRQSLKTAVDNDTYPDGVFEFLTPRVETSEGTQYVEIAVVRAGNTDKSASVNFKAVDISARYNEDYYIKTDKGIMSQRLKADESSESLSGQMAAKAQENRVVLRSEEETKSLIDEASAATDSVTDSKTGITDKSEEKVLQDSQEKNTKKALPESYGYTQVNNDNEQNNNNEYNDSVYEADGTVLDSESRTPYDLNSLIELQTGIKQEASDWTQTAGDTQDNTVSEKDLQDAYSKKYASMPGAGCELKFAPGEYIKKLRLYVIDDDIAEDDELVMLVLSDAVNAALSDNPTGLVNIKDNDEYTPSTYSIDEDKVIVDKDSDKAVITVRRNDNFTHYGEANISTASGSAESGKFYSAASTDITFVDGQEYQRVEIPIKSHPAVNEVSFNVRVDDTDSVEIVIEPYNNGEEKTESTYSEEALSLSMNSDTKGIVWSEYTNSIKSILIGRPGVYIPSPRSQDLCRDMSMVSRIEMDVRNACAGTETKERYFIFFKRTVFYKDFTTYVRIGGKDIYSKKGTIQNKEHISYNLTDSDRKQDRITIGTYVENKTYDSQAEFSNIVAYGIPIRFILGDRNTDTNGKKTTYTDKTDEDAWLYTRTYTAKDSYEKADMKDAKYIGGIKFSDGDYLTTNEADGRTREKYTYGNEKIKLEPDMEYSGLTDEEKKGVYLWGFKVERKDQKDKYYYVQGTSFTTDELYNEKLNAYTYDNNGKIIYTKLNLKNTMQYTDGNTATFKLYPVYRQKQVLVRTTLPDSDRLVFANGTYSSDEVIAVGMLDKIKYTISGKNSSMVTGYNIAMSNYATDAATTVEAERMLQGSIHTGPDTNVSDTSAALKRFNESSGYNSDSKKIVATEWNKRVYIPEEYNKGDIVVSVSELGGYKGYNMIQITASADEAAVSMTVYPATGYVSGQKEVQVQYVEANGNVQNAQFERIDTSMGKPLLRGSKISIRPFKVGQSYDFTAIVSDSDKYSIQWVDMTGDTDNDGVISAKEKLALGSYEVSDRWYSGEMFRYTPDFLGNRQLYYQAQLRTPNETGIKGEISGWVYYNSRTVIDNIPGKNNYEKVPVSGMQVVVGGETTYTDKNGYFSISSEKFNSGETYNVTLNKDGQVYSAAATVNIPIKEINIEEYSVFNVYDFTIEKYDSDNKVSDVQIYDMTNADAKFKYSFKAVPQQGVSQTIGKIDVNVYNKEGNLKKTYNAETSDGTTYIINKTAIDQADGSVSYYSFNPATQGIAPGDYMAIRVYDQDGIGYTEHKVGNEFLKNLNTVILDNSYVAPYKGIIEFIGQADLELDMGMTANIDSADGSIVSVTTVKNDEGGITKTISAGWNGDWYGDSESSGKEDEKQDNKTKDKANAGQANNDTSKTKAKSAADKAMDKAKESASSGNAKEENKKAAKELTNSNDDKKVKNKSKITNEWSAELAISFRLTMTKDADDTRWYFDDFVVVGTLEGDYKCKYSYITPIGITIFVTATLGGNVTGIIGAERYANRYQYFDDENNSIDLRTIGMSDANRSMTFYGQLDINPYVKLGAGAGIGPAVEVSLVGGANFDMKFNASGTGSGKVKLTGELQLQLVAGLITKKWLLGQYEHNMFTYGEDTPVKAMSLDLTDKDTDFRYDKVTMDDVTERSYLSGRGSWNGYSESEPVLLSSDASNTDYSDNYISEHVLEQNVYPGTTPLIEAYKHGDEDSIGTHQLMVWNDDNRSGDTYNCSKVMYSIYSHNVWSEPQQLGDDDTYDDSPYMCKLGDDKIIVMWSSADRKLSQDMTIADIFNSRNIKARIFDTATESFGPVSEVTKTTEYDKFGDDTVSCAYTKKDGKEYLIVSYEKNQYENATGDDTVVGDVLNPSSAVFYRMYDFDNNKWVDDYNNVDSYKNSSYYEQLCEQLYGQVVSPLNIYSVVDESSILDKSTNKWTRKPDKDEIKVYASPNMDKVVENTSIGYDGKAIYAYVIDEDRDLSTTNDREIEIQVYDFVKNKLYVPLRITNDVIEQSNIKFAVNDDDGVSLYYISEGDIMEYNISQLLDEGLAYENVTQYNSDITDVLVFDKSSVDYTEPVKIYESEENNPISEFDLMYDEYNTYIVWDEAQVTYKEGIDENSDEANNPENYYSEKQLHMIIRMMDENETTIYDENGEVLHYPEYDTAGNVIDYNSIKDVNGKTGVVKAGDEVKKLVKELYWTKDIQITDEQGANYSNVRFVMDTPDHLKCVAVKGMSEVMSVDGQEVSSENVNQRQLVVLSYDMTKLDYDISMDTSDVKAGDNDSQVVINVRNNSFYDMEDTTVCLYADDKLVDKQVIGLKGGYDEDIVMHYAASESADEVTLKACVYEGSPEIFNPDKTVTKTISYVDDWKIVKAAARIIDRDMAQVIVTVENEGNNISKGCTFRVSTDTGELVTSDEFELMPEEIKEITVNIPVKDEDFKQKETEYQLTESAILDVAAYDSSTDCQIVRSVNKSFADTAMSIQEIKTADMDTGREYSDRITMAENSVKGLTWNAVLDDESGNVTIPLTTKIVSEDDNIVSVINGVLVANNKGKTRINVVAVPQVSAYKESVSDSRMNLSESIMDIPSSVVKSFSFEVEVTDGKEIVNPGDKKDDSDITNPDDNQNSDYNDEADDSHNQAGNASEENGNAASTKDVNNIILLAVLMLISGFSTVYFGKKRKHSRY